MIVEPPSEGAVQESETCSFPAVAVNSVTILGTEATATGVSVTKAAAPSPAEL